ncbi:MAG: metallophosphoesterase [Rhodospirillales bacterium]|nr:metallophosphoesterase [Rhodospirillales bacterium]
MKLLLVSDLHYALKQFDWTARVAEHFDLVVFAGDHLDISGHVDGRAQIVVVLKYFERLKAKVRLIASSGNHDLDARNPAGEKFARWMSRVRDIGVPTDGESLLLDDTLFTICPWWDGPNARDAVGQLLALDAAKQKKRWIWIYHAPPDGSPTSWSGEKHFGDVELLHWIGEFAPDYVFSGHIHQSPFVRGGSWVDRIGSTWVFNAGRQIGPVPTHIVVDTERRVALWFSLAGAEIVPLDQPLQRPVRELDAIPDWLQTLGSSYLSDPGTNASS